MLLLAFLYFAIQVSALFPRSAFPTSNHPHHLARSTTCTSVCADVIAANNTCSGSQDPYCGCDKIISSSVGNSSCLSCLTRTGESIISSLVDADLFRFTVALCKCPREVNEQCAKFGDGLSECIKKKEGLSCGCAVT